MKDLFSINGTRLQAVITFGVRKVAGLVMSTSAVREIFTVQLIEKYDGNIR